MSNLSNINYVVLEIGDENVDQIVQLMNSNELTRITLLKEIYHHPAAQAYMEDALKTNACKGNCGVTQRPEHVGKQVKLEEDQLEENKQTGHAQVQTVEDDKPEPMLPFKRTPKRKIRQSKEIKKESEETAEKKIKTEGHVCAVKDCAYCPTFLVAAPICNNSKNNSAPYQSFLENGSLRDVRKEIQEEIKEEPTETTPIQETTEVQISSKTTEIKKEPLLPWQNSPARRSTRRAMQKNLVSQQSSLDNAVPAEQNHGDQHIATQEIKAEIKEEQSETPNQESTEVQISSDTAEIKQETLLPWQNAPAVISIRNGSQIAAAPADELANTLLALPVAEVNQDLDGISQPEKSHHTSENTQKQQETEQAILDNQETDSELDQGEHHRSQKTDQDSQEVPSSSTCPIIETDQPSDHTHQDDNMQSDHENNQEMDANYDPANYDADVNEFQSDDDDIENDNENQGMNLDLNDASHNDNVSTQDLEESDSSLEMENQESDESDQSQNSDEETSETDKSYDEHEAKGVDDSSRIQPQNTTSASIDAEKCMICRKMIIVGNKTGLTRYHRLLEHAKTHSDQKQFSCPSKGCGLTFTHLGNAKKHISSIHNTTESPANNKSIKMKRSWHVIFVKSFPTSEHTMKTIINKTRTAKVVANKEECMVCSRDIQASGNKRGPFYCFIQHAKVHCEKKEFSCTKEGCDYSSSQSKNVATHMKTKHNINGKHKRTVTEQLQLSWHEAFNKCFPNMKDKVNKHTFSRKRH